MNKKYIVDGVYANQSNSFFSIFEDVDVDQCIDGYLDGFGSLFVSKESNVNLSESDERSGKGIWLSKRDGFSITDKSKLYKLINDTSGLKHDQGKDMPYLLFQGCPKAVKGVSEVLTYGANKYEPNSWQNVDIDRYWNALYRHLGALHSGETHDSESGLPHIDHVATNIMFISEKLKKGE